MTKVSCFTVMQTARPLTMKKEGLQTRKRKQKGIVGTAKSKPKSSKSNLSGNNLPY